MEKSTSRFDVDSFNRHLATDWVGRSVVYHPEMDSTSTFAKDMSENEIAHGLLCITDSQTKGRGQYNRQWKSAPGQNLVFSLILKPQKSEGFHVLTLAAALSILEAVNESAKVEGQTRIKWPNDVMLNGRKAAGILTETVFAGNNLERLIIGIGLNVNQESFSSDISAEATSLYLEKHEKVEREELLAEILSRFEYKYRLWQQARKKLLKSINKNILGYGEWITLNINGEHRKKPCKMLGINEVGQMLVLNDEGGIEKFAYEQIRVVSD